MSRFGAYTLRWKFTRLVTDLKSNMKTIFSLECSHPVAEELNRAGFAMHCNQFDSDKSASTYYHNLHQRSCNILWLKCAPGINWNAIRLLPGRNRSVTPSKNMLAHTACDPNPNLANPELSELLYNLMVAVIPVLLAGCPRYYDGLTADRMVLVSTICLAANPSDKSMVTEPSAVSIITRYLLVIYEADWIFLTACKEHESLQRFHRTRSISLTASRAHSLIFFDLSLCSIICITGLVLATS